MAMTSNMMRGIACGCERYHPESVTSSKPSVVLDDLSGRNFSSNSDVSPQSYSPHLPISPAASLSLSRLPADHRKQRVNHSSVPCRSLQPKSQVKNSCVQCSTLEEYKNVFFTYSMIFP